MPVIPTPAWPAVTKTSHPMPLTDPHPILVGILNGWNTPVTEQEKPVQRLMANLHRSLMLEGPLVRPIDQLAIPYLAQMSLLVRFDPLLVALLCLIGFISQFLLALHEAYRAYLGHIPGWLYPMPQLRMRLLSQPDVENYDTQPCNDFATATLHHRLTLSPRFSQLFSPGAPMSPFAVSPAFVAQYPALRDLVPEWQAHVHVYQPHRSRPEVSQNLIALPSQSRFSGFSAGDDQPRPDRANPGLLEASPSRT
ncbi:hypothetical protein BDV12DRAFT_202003 [Aspergillus spectabilis]